MKDSESGAYDMSGSSAFSNDLDKAELETDFFSPLSEYSEPLAMSEADISPLPVYNDTNNGLPSFSNHLVNEHIPQARMVGHGAATPSQNAAPSDEQKRMKQAIRRERNRAAAAKCRQKKLDRIHYLQTTADSLRAVNDHLILRSLQLQNEIQELRRCLADHQRQGCVCDYGIASNNGYN